MLAHTATHIDIPLDVSSKTIALLASHGPLRRLRARPLHSSTF